PAPTPHLRRGPRLRGGVRRGGRGGRGPVRHLAAAPHAVIRPQGPAPSVVSRPGPDAACARHSRVDHQPDDLRACVRGAAVCGHGWWRGHRRPYPAGHWTFRGRPVRVQVNLFTRANIGTLGNRASSMNPRSIRRYAGRSFSVSSSSIMSRCVVEGYFASCTCDIRLRSSSALTSMLSWSWLSLRVRAMVTHSLWSRTVPTTLPPPEHNETV